MVASRSARPLLLRRARPPRQRSAAQAQAAVRIVARPMARVPIGQWSGWEFPAYLFSITSVWKLAIWPAFSTQSMDLSCRNHPAAQREPARAPEKGQ